MFNFLENDEILTAKRKQMEKEYRKELLIQIEENKLRKSKENIQFKNEKILNNGLFKGKDKTYFIKENNNSIKNIKSINLSKDNIKLFNNPKLIKLSLNDKFSSLKKLLGIHKDNNTKTVSLFSLVKFLRNKNNFNKLRLSTDYNKNKINFKSAQFKINKDKILNTDNNINLYQSNKYTMKKTLSQMLKNFSIKLSNIKNNKKNSVNKNLMDEIDIQFLFKEFVEQQIKTINDFASNLEDIFYFKYTNKDNDIKNFNSMVINEKNKAIKNIDNFKNKLKQKFGFFPMEKIYDSRIEQLFNKIINKITTIYSSISLAKIDNYINKSNSNNNIFKNKDFKFYEINRITSGKYNISKSIEFTKDINSNKKFNLVEDLNFFDFWKNRFENEIMRDKNNKLKINETINNKKEENLIVLPANNFLKNIKLRNINSIKSKDKDKNEMKLPSIKLKEITFQRRNNSANNKNSEKFF